jgi:dephospho-CoA kinase
MEKLAKDNPIIIGLAGKAGAGKTSVAEQIVPKGAIESIKDGMKWDHIFFALPLYEMASIRKNIKGEREKSRKLFALHEVLYDVYGGSAIGSIPDYDSFIELVNKIYSLHIEPEGTKPRTFLQGAGDLCRSYDYDCFAKWGILRSKKIYRDALRSMDEQEEMSVGVIISDVRYPNEAQIILDQPNGFVVCFDATQETLDARLMKRDGKVMSPEAAEHSSEKQMDIIKEMASIVIDTNGLDIEQQTSATLQFVNKIKEELNA